MMIGLALAGGGPLGIIYEIGVLLALDDALDGVALNELDIYVGVSAGALVASALANGFTPAKLCQVFVLNRSPAFPMKNPERFLRPSLHQCARTLAALPGLGLDVLQAFLDRPRDSGLPGVLSQLAAALPPGLWDNDPIDHMLARIYRSRGRSNDFRRLKRRLLIMAMNLDTGEIVRFGAPGNDHIAISKAVQASTAVPGLFPPVRIGGRYYVDGGVRKTVHASTALAAGAKLLICVNPIVSFHPRLAEPRRQRRLKSLMEGGLPVVMAQAVRTLLHSRMKAGMARYAIDYPDRDILLFEPNRGDADMFFAGIFSFAQRLRVCEHAYQTTRRELLARRDSLEPLLRRYGVALRLDVLTDPRRRFDSHLHIPPEETRLAKLQHPVTNDLSDALDQLEHWLQRRRSVAARSETPSETPG